MRQFIFFAVAVFSCTAFAQNLRRDDQVNFAAWSQPSSFAVMPKARVPVIKSDVPNWSLEGKGYQLKCDEVADTCRGAMLRSSPSAGSQSSVRLIHHESALPWRGVDLVFRAELRVGQSAGEARLVARIEDLNGNEVFRVTSAPLRGTTRFGWQTLKLHVPDDAERVSFALEFAGSGAVFFRELSFDDAESLATATN